MDEGEAGAGADGHFVPPLSKHWREFARLEARYAEARDEPADDRL